MERDLILEQLAFVETMLAETVDLVDVLTTDMEEGGDEVQRQLLFILTLHRQMLVDTRDGLQQRVALN